MINFGVGDIVRFINTDPGHVSQQAINEGRLKLGGLYIVSSLSYSEHIYLQDIPGKALWQQGFQLVAKRYNWGYLLVNRTSNDRS